MTRLSLKLTRNHPQKTGVRGGPIGPLGGEGLKEARVMNQHSMMT